MTKPILVLRHVAEEALGKLEATLHAAGAALQVVACFGDDWSRFERGGFPASEIAGLVVMGGTMNVDQTDRYPFLATEVDWLRHAVAAQMPVLGICLGAQLVAKSLGAPVYKNRVREIGWHGIELLPAALDDPLFSGASSGQTVFQWHGDTFDLPEGAVWLARGAACRHQAFRYRRSAYAVQFHPEMTAEMVSDWLDDPPMRAEAEATAGVDIERIRTQSPVALAESSPLVEQIFRRFAELCHQHDLVVSG